MARSSSGTSSSGEGSLRDLNARMVARLMSGSAQPLVEHGYALRVLETRGRVSGSARRTPIGVLQSEGQWWLVSPNRGRDWVRNLLADRRCALLAAGDRVPRWAIELDDDRVADVVVEYLSLVTVPWARQAFPVSPDDPGAVVLERAPTMAVFRLEPVREDDGDAGGAG